MNIVGIGNALVDIVTEIPSDEILIKLGLPKGSMTLIDESSHNHILKITHDLKHTFAAGGSAANTINGLAKMGIDCAFIGKISDDLVGTMFREDQISNGIKPLLLDTDVLPSGKCISLVSPCKERTMATFLGAASTLEPEEVKVPECDLLYVEGYLLYNQDLIESVMIQAVHKGIKIAIDLASYNVVADNLDFLQMLLEKYVDIVFANEEEAKEYSNKSAHEALEVFASHCEISVVKLGAKGSLVACGKERHTIGVIDAVPHDKTGAGDLYAAGFLYGYSKGLNLKMCGDIGAVLSSKVVEVIGPKMPEQVWHEIHGLVSKIENGEQVVNRLVE